MFGSLGGLELLVLAGIGLLVFGPRKLPQMGRAFGRTLLEFRRAAMEVRTSIEREINIEELRQTGESIRRDIRTEATTLARAADPSVTSPPQPPVPPPAPPPGDPPPDGDVVREG